MTLDDRKDNDKISPVEPISFFYLKELLYSMGVEKSLLANRSSKSESKFKDLFMSTRNVVDICLKLGVKQNRRQSLGLWLKNTTKETRGKYNYVKNFPESETIYFSIEESVIMISKALGYICGLKYSIQKDVLIEAAKNVLYQILETSQTVLAIKDYPSTKIDYVYNSLLQKDIPAKYLRSDSAQHLHTLKDKYLTVEQVIELCIGICVDKDDVRNFKDKDLRQEYLDIYKKVRTSNIYKKVRTNIRRYLVESYALFYKINEKDVFVDPQATEYVNWEIVASTLFNCFHFLQDIKELDSKSPCKIVSQNIQPGSLPDLANNITQDIASSCVYIKVLKEIPLQYKPNRKTRRVQKNFKPRTTKKD